MSPSRQTSIATTEGPVAVARVDNDHVRLAICCRVVDLTLAEAEALWHALRRAVT